MTETIEQAAEIAYQFEADSNFPDETEHKNFVRIFKKGANWVANKMYSEEDMIKFHKWAYLKNRVEESDKTTKELLSEWFEQFKKK